MYPSSGLSPVLGVVWKQPGRPALVKSNSSLLPACSQPRNILQLPMNAFLRLQYRVPEWSPHRQTNLERERSEDGPLNHTHWFNSECQIGLHTTLFLCTPRDHEMVVKHTRQRTATCERSILSSTRPAAVCILLPSCSHPSSDTVSAPSTAENCGPIHNRSSEPCLA